MELGNQIRTLRLRRGITQEAMAQHFGITPQAVSKWERGVATPDISLLPDLSAYFGVTIDELFSVSDDTRMERIQNMLWDVPYLSAMDVEAAREFLLRKANREPDNGDPHSLLAQMENHIARSHRDLAAEYAMEALRRNHKLKSAHSELTEAMGGICGDWITCNHHALIEFYKDFVTRHPDYVSGYIWLCDQLIASNRLEEAVAYIEKMSHYDASFRTPFYRGMILLAAGERSDAMAVFEKMMEDYGEDWCTWMSMGDVYARTGEFEKAKECYRKYLELQSPPRYTDGLTAIAHICESQGDYAGAIEAVHQELELLRTDWQTTTGETVDQHFRTISRLEAKLKSRQK